jgi:amidohydrolase family protein
MALLSLILGPALAIAPPFGGDVHAIENVRLPGATQDVTILLRDGRIEAIGAELAVPPEAERIDGLGTTALPGFIDGFSDLGVARGEKSPPPESASEGVAQDYGGDAFAETAEASRRGLFPERRARLLLAPLDPDASEKLRVGGFTEVVSAPADGFLAGQACLVELSGLPARDAVVVEPGWLHAKLRGGNLGGGYPVTVMGALAHLRQALLDAQRLKSWREAWRRSPATVARPPSDDCLDTLIRLLDHQLRFAFAVDSENDIRRALALAQEFHVDGLIVGGKEGFKCAGALAAAHVPVVASLALPDAPERKGAKRKKAEAKPGEPPPGKRDEKGAALQAAGDVVQLPDAAPPAAAAEPAAAPPTATSADPPPAGPNVAPPPEWEVADPVLAEPLELFEQRQARWLEEVQNVQRLLEAGVSVALTTRGSSSVGDFFADLRVAIEKGLPAEAALKALTETPAALLGVDRELGALKPGMAADLILVEGDLASADRAVRHVFVSGRHFEGPKKKETKPGEGGDKATPAEGKPGEKANLDLTGTWELKNRGAGQGFTAKLTLKQEGSKLSGRLVSEMGEAEISSGSLDGAGWKIVVTADFHHQQFDFVLSGTADAELMTGTMTTPFGDPVDVVARRAPKGAQR